MESNSSHRRFGRGIWRAGILARFRFRHTAARITIIDRSNHHLFQPLLYQVATAGLSAPEIAQPIRSILAGRQNVTVLMESVIDFKLAEKKVVLANGELAYDFLVLALGGCTSYFGHPEWEKHAPGLKSLEDAIRIRSQILLAFEKAETEESTEEQARLMTTVVVWRRADRRRTGWSLRRVGPPRVAGGFSAHRPARRARDFD